MLIISIFAKKLWDTKLVRTLRLLHFEYLQEIFYLMNSLSLFATQFKWTREKCSWHLVWGNTSNRSKSALSTQIDKWYCFWIVYVYVLHIMCGNVPLAKKVSGKIYSIDFGPHLLALKWFVGNDSAIYNQTVLCLSTNSWDKYNCVACGF